MKGVMGVNMYVLLSCVLFVVLLLNMFIKAADDRNYCTIGFSLEHTVVHSTTSCHACMRVPQKNLLGSHTQFPWVCLASAAWSTEGQWVPKRMPPGDSE